VSESAPDYAYRKIEEYEEIIGYKTGDAFRIGWNMARITNTMLGIQPDNAEIARLSGEAPGYRNPEQGES